MDHRTLLDRWRREVDVLRRHGSVEAATSLEACIADVEQFEQDYENEPLPPAVASEESGYSISWLLKMISEGRIPNAGRPYAPMIRRGDLPRKFRPVGNHRPDGNHRRPDGSPSLVDDVLERQGLVAPENS